MRVVFMGTPDFAVPSLRALAHSHEVIAVYTRPDAISGRGKALRPSPIKTAALEMGLMVRQPASLRDATEARVIVADEPDLIVVAAYGLILPRAVLDAARLGAVNVHASLLPRWRGAAPVQRAILAGDELTGVSIMFMEEGLDTGPYCEVEVTPVEDKNSTSLTTELASLGARALMRAVARISDGTCQWQEQDEELVTYAAKIEKSDVALDPRLRVDDAARRVRASDSHAPARMSVGGRAVTIVSAVPDHSVHIDPGAVVPQRDSVLLGLSDGAIAADTVKPDGKSEMSAADWARGSRFTDSTRWEAL